MLSEVLNVVGPAFWPYYHTLYLLLVPENVMNRKPMKVLDYKFEWKASYIITFNLLIFFYGGVSWISYAYTFPDLSQPINWFYWVPVIILRDLFITWIIYEPWHYLTHVSPKYVAKLKPKKFNPEFPDQEQWTHDRFWSLVGTVIAALHEILAIYLWSIGYMPYYIGFWKYPIYSIGWSLFHFWWRHFHFYFVHRMIHPWVKNKDSILKYVDGGHYLYKYVHSLHHKSYNPGPWSGLSMHPIEHIFYYSCVWFPTLWVPQHPIHFMIDKFHATISPAPGHDGYDTPIGGGGGGYFHYLHHAHFECNYGTDMVPLDWFLGTFADGSKFANKKK